MEPPDKQRTALMNTNIYETIKSRILFLEYPPRMVLNDKILCKEFEVSRTPIREVLTHLQGESLVRIFPRMGTMVTEIEFQQMMNALQVRKGIEFLLGSLAAEEITALHLDKLKQIHTTCKNLAHKKNKKRLVQLDMAFRNVLYAASKNDVLNQHAQSLYELTLRLWVSSIDKGSWADEVNFVADKMKKMIDVFSQKRSDDAGKMKSELLSVHYDRISEKFFGPAF